MNDKKLEQLLEEFFKGVSPVGLFVIIIYLFEEIIELIALRVYDWLNKRFFK